MEDYNKEKIKEARRSVIRDKNSIMQLMFLGVLVLILWFYEPVLAIIATLIFGYLIFNSLKNTKERQGAFIKYIEGLSDDFDSATKHAIFNMPFPLVMIQKDMTISWYNTPFLNMIERDDALGAQLEDIIPGIDGEKILERDNGSLNIEFSGKHYKIYPNIVETEKSKMEDERMIMLYWVDDTEFVQLENLYDRERLTVSLVYVDNYSDVRDTTPETHRPIVLAEIDKKINSYFSNYEAIVRKYENDKYLVIYDNWVYEDLVEKKFDFLDEFREMDIGNTIPITLSMGVSAKSKNPVTGYRDARASVDIALGRGGDQVVVQDGGKVEFYGGKSKAVEKRNKVRSRVIAYALRQLIEQSDKVFVMGHKNPDMDSYGAGIGILSGVRDRGVDGYLILNTINPSIKNIHDSMRERDPEIEDEIIGTEEALDLVTEDSLIILVDTHKPSFAEAPELFEETKRTVVIDHHRRGAEFVQDPMLVYLEPYASSASELVTEVLSYMGDKINLSKFEAEALLAGITVDTKNFSFQTGVRTFEAASTLKRAGADTTEVRRFFRDDLDTFMYKAEVIQSAEIYDEKIAIGILDREMENSILVAAQSADELLSINGIEASFVLTRVDDKIHISGRSLGNVSVQIILERLGGGGHLTSAGAQLSVGMEEAKEHLVEAVEEYLEEGEE